MQNNNIFNMLQEQKNNKCKNTFYYISQLEFAYNSCKLAGNSLSYNDIQLIYEENSIMCKDKLFKLDDIFEIYNHFTLFDYILNNINTPISQDIIKNLYKILKKNTREEIDFSNTFGEFRKQKLEHVNYEISLPSKITKDLDDLIIEHESNNNITLNELAEFHYKFECIHPFNDANGRIGRIILFKECLRNNITPFIILYDSKLDYYRGLKAYKEEKRILTSYFSKLQQIYEDVANQFDDSYKF